MKQTQAIQPSERAPHRDRWILAALGFMALFPYALYHGMFDRLYWFGDEFDLIDQMDRLGFWRWVWLVFAENFVPLFKVLWGGAVLAFGGSYGAMIAILWLTHALNVVLLGRLMRTCGLSWTAALVALIPFGLTASNLETLAWSVQWSSVLSVTFMLLAMDGFARRPFLPAPVGWAAASALSFSRGVLTGLLLAFACILPNGRETSARLSLRITYAAAFMLPALVVALLITRLMPSGNQTHMEGHWGDAAVFGAWYYCLNPAYRLLGFDSWGLRTVMMLGFLKIALVAWSVARARDRKRKLFVMLVLFDLGNAVLLGIGRYHTGLPASVSSRYQYASLIGILPLAGFWFSEQWEKIPFSRTPRRIALVALSTVAVICLCRQWPADLGPFTTWRGTDSRRVILGNSDQGPQGVPGIPGLPMARARQLAARYSLH